jgi:hypothetical protein
LDQIQTAQIAHHGASNLVTAISTYYDENKTALAIANNIQTELETRIMLAMSKLQQATMLSDLSAISSNFNGYVEESLKNIQNLSNYITSGASQEDNIDDIFNKNPNLAMKELFEKISKFSNNIGPVHISNTAEYRKTMDKIESLDSLIQLADTTYGLGITDMTANNYNFAVRDLWKLLNQAKKDITQAASYNQLQGISDRIDTERSFILRTHTPPKTTVPVLPTAQANFSNAEITAITTGVVSGLALLLIFLNRNKISYIYNSCSSIAKTGMTFFKNTLSFGSAINHRVNDNQPRHPSLGSR